MIAILIALVAGLFTLGLATTFWRSPNHNPLEQLTKNGVNIEAQIVDLEPDGDEPNVVVSYQVAGQRFRRSLPWNPNLPLPTLGQTITVRYLPSSPGLSRLA